MWSGFWNVTSSSDVIEHKYEIQNAVDWVRKWLCGNFSNAKKFDPMDVMKDGFVHDENSSFKMLGFPFCSKLDLGSYTLSIANNASKPLKKMDSWSVRWISFF